MEQTVQYKIKIKTAIQYEGEGNVVFTAGYFVRASSSQDIDKTKNVIERCKKKRPVLCYNTVMVEIDKKRNVGK